MYTDRAYQIYNDSTFNEYLKIVQQLKGNGNFINRPELYLTYDRMQKDNYFKHPELSIYSQWDKPWGIHKTGKNFPAMVAQKFLKDQNYNVFISGAKSNGYALIRYRKSKQKYPGYHLLLKLFDKANVEAAITEADNNNLSGGDPDIFVSNNSTATSFFIEVKEDDKLTDNQIGLFPIIEKYLCPVLLIRVREK